MNGNISGIPQSLRVQADRLTEFTTVINPYIGKLNELVAKVQEIEAVLEAAYLEWIADCAAAGNELGPPPVDNSGTGNDPLSDYVRIKIYEAITNNIDQYPPTNPDDWFEVDNFIVRKEDIPKQPFDWKNIQNYVIRDQAKLVFGPPPPRS